MGRPSLPWAAPFPTQEVWDCTRVKTASGIQASKASINVLISLYRCDFRAVMGCSVEILDKTDPSSLGCFLLEWVLHHSNRNETKTLLPLLHPGPCYSFPLSARSLSTNSLASSLTIYCSQLHNYQKVINFVFPGLTILFFWTR